MRRSTSVALLLSVLALVGSFAALAYANVRNTDRVEDIARVVTEIQHSRIEARRQSCAIANRQAIAIREFVSQVNPTLREQVREAFPISSCR